MAIDLLVASLVAVGGLVVAGSVWARRLAIGLVTIPLLTMLVLDIGTLTLLAAAVSTAAAVSLIGPWLTPHVGSRRRLDAPPSQAVALALLLLLQPGWIGVASREGITPGLWFLAAACFGLAWAYGRALSPSLRILRWVFLPVTVLAVFGSALPVGAAITLYSVAVTAMAWTREARAAVEAPEPVVGTAIPIPLRHVPSQVRPHLRVEIRDEQ